MGNIISWLTGRENVQLEHSNDSVFCNVMKNQTFNSSDGPKLNEKMKPSSSGSDKFGKIEKILNCALGNGRNGVFPIPDVVNQLMMRDYSEVVSFDGQGKLVIFIPEWYLSKAIKCVDPTRSDTLQNYSKELISQTDLSPERRKYFQDLKLFNYYVGGQRVDRGEIPERNLYAALRAYFNGRDQTVAVFHGINILKMNLDKFKVNEKDFVIINATHKCIMVVEVKNCLGAGNSVEKSKTQLLDAKEDFEAWFASEGLENWRFIPLIYTEQIAIEITCSECKKYVIVGMSLF